MKIAVIGGAGMRTPLLVRGLSLSDLPIEELALFDVDPVRLRLIGMLAGRLAGRFPVRACAHCTECIEGADFVFTSIRVGGIEGRALDEAAVLRRGIVGQETVGPGGFAMAMRTIPPMVSYAREIVQKAPKAWIINFSNPVGIVTQAVFEEAGARIIGICDTPAELFHDVASALGLHAEKCYFDYLGLNHLGWLREVYCGGQPQLRRFWENPDRLAGVYRHALFEKDFLLDLKLLPTEYLYYYYRPREAVHNIRSSGTTRGSSIAGLNAQLFAELELSDVDPVQAYERYLAARNAGYMQIESGSPPALPVSPWSSPTGYDKIALAVVRAIHFNTGAIMPLDVPNRGNIGCLESGDIVEVPCVVNGNGALPMSVGALPASIRELVQRVKEYERLTVRAAVARDAGLALRALAANPLVPDSAVARTLLSDLGLP